MPKEFSTFSDFPTCKTGTRVTSVEFIVISDVSPFHILSYYAKRILDFFRLSHMQDRYSCYFGGIHCHFRCPQVLKEKGTHFTKIKQTSIVFFRAVQNFPSSFVANESSTYSTKPIQTGVKIQHSMFWLFKCSTPPIYMRRYSILLKQSQTRVVFSRSNFSSPQSRTGTYFTEKRQTSIVSFRAVQNFPSSLLQMRAVLILLSQFKLK
jgi:hypothetical protein